MADLPIETLAQRIRWARICAGLTNAKLAEIAGLTEATISRVETGAVKAPSLDTLARIADALGCPMAWLARAEGDEPLPAAIRAHVGGG